MPKVTVYIPSHNYGRYLMQAVESVLRQTYDDWELLIINDNSTDNTEEVMNLYKGDPRVRLFTTPGIGLHGVCNLALQESRGEYLIRLDGDDLFDENILLVLSNCLDRNKDHALVFPDYYLIDEFGDIFAQERREKLYESNHMLDAPPHGACTMIRRKVFEEVGGYRQDLAAQDGYYIWSKIAGLFKCTNVNLPLFYYRRHGTNLTNKSFRILEARRKIKKETILLKLEDFRPFTAIIPCRKHYDFRTDAWKSAINGKSLLQHKVATCLQSGILDKVVVTCDNQEAEECLAEFKDSRLEFRIRKQEETIRSQSVVPTLERIVKELDPAWKGVTVLSYIQTPFVSTDAMEEAIFTLVMNDADCCFGVIEIDQPLYRRSSFGLEAINPKRTLTSDFDLIYAESNTFLATRNRNLRTGSLTGPRVVNFVVPADECFVIDSDKKLQIAGIMEAQRRTLGI